MGNHPSFSAAGFALVSPWELTLYALLGMLAALWASGFVNLLYASEDAFERLRIPAWSKGAIGFAAVGVVGIWFPQIFGVGYDAIQQVFYSHVQPAHALTLAVLKPLATSLTLGSGGSGGVFAPSLFTGAFLGDGFGALAHHAFPAWTGPAAAYGLVGMAAVFAAASEAPITAIMIVFEMSDDYTIILPLMVAVVIATLLGRRLLGATIYERKLLRRGIDWQRIRNPRVFARIFVSRSEGRHPSSHRRARQFGRSHWKRRRRRNWHCPYAKATASSASSIFRMSHMRLPLEKGIKPSRPLRFQRTMFSRPPTRSSAQRRSWPTRVLLCSRSSQMVHWSASSRAGTFSAPTAAWSRSKMSLLRHFAKGIWIADGPNVRVAFVPLPTRVIVVRLGDGLVWINSPIQASPEVLEQVRAIGPVRYLVAPTPLHVWRLKLWSGLFPDAQLWGPPKARSSELTFTGILGDAAPAEWCHDIEQLVFRGNAFIDEVEFFHKPSRTVMLTDFIRNSASLDSAPSWESFHGKSTVHREGPRPRYARPPRRLGTSYR